MPMLSNNCTLVLLCRVVANHGPDSHFVRVTIGVNVTLLLTLLVLTGNGSVVGLFVWSPEARLRGIMCLRIRGLAGSCNSHALFSSVDFKVSRNGHVTLVTRGKAKGSALLGVLANERAPSGNAVACHGSVHINYLIRRPRFTSGVAISRTYFSDGDSIMGTVGRCRRLVRGRTGSPLCTSRVRVTVTGVSHLGT